MRRTPPVIGLGITIAVAAGFAGIPSTGEALIIIGFVLLHEATEHARDIFDKLRRLPPRE